MYATGTSEPGPRPKASFKIIFVLRYHVVNDPLRHLKKAGHGYGFIGDFIVYTLHIHVLPIYNQPHDSMQPC